MTWDPRLAAWVAAGHRRPELRRWAREEGLAHLEDWGAGAEALDPDFHDPRTPRDYQWEAVRRWESAGRRGSVVLPTGAGKSLVGLLAIRERGKGPWW